MSAILEQQHWMNGRPEVAQAVKVVSQVASSVQSPVVGPQVERGPQETGGAGQDAVVGGGEGALLQFEPGAVGGFDPVDDRQVEVEGASEKVPALEFVADPQITGVVGSGVT